MLPGIELAGCHELAVPADVMHHVIQVESSYNPYAIGVVGGRLARQPRSLPEALATARMLERRGYDFSLGLAQVNRRNLARYGLGSYAEAFQACPNVQAGARILADCNARAGGDWGKAFSCYYAGDFTTGFRHGYVRKVFASMRAGQGSPRSGQGAMAVIDRKPARGSVRPAGERMQQATTPPAARRIAALEPAQGSVAGPAPAQADTAFVF